MGSNGSKIEFETKKLCYFYYYAKFAQDKFWAYVIILAITFSSELQIWCSTYSWKAKRQRYNFHEDIGRKFGAPRCQKGRAAPCILGCVVHGQQLIRCGARGIHRGAKRGSSEISSLISLFEVSFEPNWMEFLLKLLIEVLEL